MAYSKDLGNVRGKTGAFVKPRVLDENENPDPTKTVIRWELKEESNEETFSDTVIESAYFIPYVEAGAPYVLKWRGNIEGMEVPDDMALPKGQPGVSGISIEPIASYGPTIDDNDIKRIIYHYYGDAGEHTSADIEEGTIYLILDAPDPNNIGNTTTIAYLYNEPDAGDPSPNPEDLMYATDDYGNHIQDDNGHDIAFDVNNFIKIEQPIDLSNYYTKTEVYTKEEINNMFGQISNTQDRIINILDSGLAEFNIQIEEPEPENSEEPDAPNNNEEENIGD